MCGWLKLHPDNQLRVIIPGREDIFFYIEAFQLLSAAVKVRPVWFVFQLNQNPIGNQCHSEV